MYEPLEQIVADTKGPFSTMRKGSLLVLTLTDFATNYIWVFPFDKKSEIPEVVAN